MQSSMNNTLKLKRKNITIKKIVEQRALIFMSVPIVLYVLLFRYVPLYGWTMAFQNFKPYLKFEEQVWVGLDQFKFLFASSLTERVLNVLRNTVCMSAINLILGTLSAIIFALMLNEVRNKHFKKSIQTISYLPHFLSWIIAVSLISSSLSISGGIINEVLKFLGIIDEGVLWLSKPKLFWLIVGLSHVWKDMGWNTIIYLSAITSINPELYEAAAIDGAGKLRKISSITLPGIKNTIVILLIMNIGHLMEAGFEVQFLLGNGLVQRYSETIDIFVLKYGIGIGNYSLATALGIFKCLVSIVLLFSANKIAGLLKEETLV